MLFIGVRGFGIQLDGAKVRDLVGAMIRDVVGAIVGDLVGANVEAFVGVKKRLGDLKLGSFVA